MSTKRMLVGLAAAGLVAAGSGSAFTANNTVAASVAGYGTSTISGATATSVVYTLSADGTTITGATIDFTGDLTGRSVKAGFGTDPLTTCTLAAHNATANTTTGSCTFTGVSTSAATAFSVAVG